jgi:hypothetical protein
VLPSHPTSSSEFDREGKKMQQQQIYIYICACANAQKVLIAMTFPTMIEKMSHEITK